VGRPKTKELPTALQHQERRGPEQCTCDNYGQLCRRRCLQCEKDERYDYDGVCANPATQPLYSHVQQRTKHRHAHQAGHDCNNQEADEAEHTYWREVETHSDMD
jgi:hypothetical protein